MSRLIGKGHLAIWGGFSFAVAIASPAVAQTALDLGTVQANGGVGGSGSGEAGGAAVASAPYQAPTRAPLNATQPTSVISQQYIQNNVAPSGSYDSVVAIAPSVSAVSPNGPGLMENQVLSMRGFQDGQYNVTFDGIPWGDSNDFTHHTTSYFMARDIGATIVDRGPGTASTIGNATFGGTIAILSKDPASAFAFSPYVSFGSFNTQVFGAQIDSGPIASANGATGFIDAQGLNSDGYLTNASLKRKNVFGKIIVPLNADNVLTFVTMYNTLHQNVSLGATKAQIQQFGPNFGLSSDPASQAYFGYNYDTINTDFEYIGLKSDLHDGLTIDNKAYTYAYYHHGFNGEDPNGETPNGTVYGVNNVPGQTMHMDYRSFGDVLRVKKELGFGDIQAGIWYDHQVNSRQQLEVDMTLHMAGNPPGAAGIDRNMHDSLDTVQPYLQIDWKPLPGLTISPGVKFNYFLRGIDASVNQKTLQPLNYSKAYSAATPSLSVNYRFTPNLSAYAQVAQGFLAPNLNVLYTTNPGASSVTPQTSTNYQIGGVFTDRRLTLSGDLYYIDFGNLIGSRTIAGTTVFFNQGGVTYKGVEAEATYYVGYGFSLYGNGSLNDAKDKQSHQWVANAPEATAAAGIIYNRDGVYGSLLEKWVGSRFGDTGQTQGLQPYGVLNASLGYTHEKGEGPAWIPPGSVKLVAYNLTDTHVINGLAGYTGGANTPLYWTVPGRSVFVTATVKF
jgi:iron complex outermembrane receptor protein